MEFKIHAFGKLDTDFTQTDIKELLSLFTIKNLKVKQMDESKVRILFTIEDKEEFEACYSRFS